MPVVDDLGTKAYSGMGREGTTYIETLGPRIVAEGILHGRSALSSTERAWTVRAAEELIAVYVDSPDVSAESFDNKLRKQVSSASREARLLFADLILLNLLPLSDYGSVRKRELIRLPLEDLDPPIHIPPDIDAALSYGMFRGGIGFKSGRFARLRWLITFAHYACGRPEEVRTKALGDPLSFREFVRAAPGGTEAAQRQSLLYLTFPWFYLPTIIPSQRKQIRDAFAHDCLPDGPTDDVDVDLHRIYAQLTRAASGPIDFYRDPAYERRWKDPEPRTQRRVWIFQSNPDLYDLREFLSRPDIGPGATDSWLLRQHADEVADGDTVLFWIAGRDAGIYATGTIVGESFIRRREEWEPDDAPAESRAIGYRLDRSLVDHPVLRADLLTKPVLAELQIIRQPSGTNFPVTQQQWEMLRTLLERPTRPEPVRPDIDWLVGEIYWNKSEVDDLIETLLTRKPQAILAGPPGTGKTYVAKKVAKHLTNGHPSGVHVVQFHPSYAYEDFVEGLRPVANDKGQVTFEVTAGKLVKIADLARNADHPVVLVIDEINRANLPSVFGELLYLLEYRDDKIELLHRSGFSLPRNLFIIGTMNTADRSIRSVDTALRRRFDIFDCAPRAEVLERFYDREDNLAEVDDLVDGFDALNEKLCQHIDHHHTIGHSFFMGSTYTASDLRRTWQRQILPLISEYFFDQPALVNEFDFGELWPSQKQP